MSRGTNECEAGDDPPAKDSSTGGANRENANAGGRANTASVLALILLPFVLSFPLVRFTEPDAFYHLRHAWIYVERGLSYNEFPWHTQSLVGRTGSDLWYGFHVLLIPFSLIDDPMLSAKMAASAFLCLFLLFFYKFARKEGLPLPFVWPLFVIGASYHETSRYLSMRPFLISLGLGLWAFSIALGSSDEPEGGIANPRQQRAKTGWLLAACCFGISWAHAAFFWLGPLVVGGVLALRAVLERRWQPSIFLYALLGTAIGLAARPNPLGGLNLLKVQLIDLGVALRTDPYMNFGSEIYPMSRVAYGWDVPFFSVWLLLVAACVLLGKRGWKDSPRRWRTGFAVSFAFALGFLFVAWFTSYRAADLWILFATISMAYSVGIYVSSRNARSRGDGPRRGKWLLATVSAACGLFLAANTAVAYWAINSGGTNIYRLSDAMTWLMENTNEGDIVYNMRWSDFGEAFFWNTRNRYITGMDPIFLYALDRSLYYKFTELEVDRYTSQVTGKPDAAQPKFEDTYEVLKRDFHAKYVLVSPLYSPNFLGFLFSDSRFRAVYWPPPGRVPEEDAFVFEVL